MHIQNPLGSGCMQATYLTHNLTRLANCKACHRITMLSYLRTTLSSLVKRSDHDGSDPVMSALSPARRSNPSNATNLVHHGSSTWLEQPSRDIPRPVPTFDNANFPPLPTMTAQAVANHVTTSPHTRDTFYECDEGMGNVSEEHGEKFIPVNTLRRYSPVRTLEELDHSSRHSTVLHRPSCFATFASYLDDDEEEPEEDEEPTERHNTLYKNLPGPKSAVPKHVSKGLPKKPKSPPAARYNMDPPASNNHPSNDIQVLADSPNETPVFPSH